MHLLQGVLSRKFKLKANKLNRTNPVCSKTDKSPAAAGDDSRTGGELSALVLTETTEWILRLLTGSVCSLLQSRRNSVVLSCFICLRFDDKGRNGDRKHCPMPLILLWNSLYFLIDCVHAAKVCFSQANSRIMFEGILGFSLQAQQYQPFFFVFLFFYFFWFLRGRMRRNKILTRR